MKKETRAKVIALLAAIHDTGLDELVAGNHAFQTLHRIIKTGTSLYGGVKETYEDTEENAILFSKPELWGWVDDRSRQEEWAKFCEGWAS